MAGSDYKSCDICGCKTFYDSVIDYPEPTKENDWEYIPERVGDWKVICEECAKTKKIIIIDKPLNP